MGLLEGFWHHEYWLPPGATWEDMKESADIRYPQPPDLLLCIPGALLLIVVRCIFERTVALPLGRQLGVSDKLRPKVQPNATLEGFYVQLGRTPKEGDLISLAKQSDLPVKKVETWFRHRRAQDQPRLMKKFCEASWRFAFYFSTFFSGLALLYDKPWFWDHNVCWLSFPQQPLPPSLGWFYLLELSFYCSLVATLPFDVKRKDFTEQIIHHIATITLICVSYCANLIRFGMMVMLVHDASDYILELAKMLLYMKWKRGCEAAFIIFAVVFIISRLVVFPLTTYYYFVTKFQLFLISCLINTFLMILQLLHIFWSYLIIQMIFGVILRGGKRKDARSDSEESDRSEAEDLASEEQRRTLPKASSNVWIEANIIIAFTGSEVTLGDVFFTSAVGTILLLLPYYHLSRKKKVYQPKAARNQATGS